MSELKDLTYQELVDRASRDIHSNLLETGGQGLKSSVHQWMHTAIIWNKEKCPVVTHKVKKAAPPIKAKKSKPNTGYVAKKTRKRK